MSRRTTPETIGYRVSEAIVSGGANVATVARAADMGAPDLIARLDGRREFTVRELVRVGGFLRISPSSLLMGGNT